MLYRERERERNSGIDALRIVATFMVLMLHILGQGGLLAALPSHSLRYKAAWLMEVACYCAVNCYGLISGYVGVNSRSSYSSILRTWLHVAFYTVSASVVLHFFIPNIVTLATIKNAFFPVTTNKYWYYTAYFCMSFFMPAMNHLLNTFPQKQLRFLIFSGGVLFCVVPMWLNNDLFYLKNGYTVLWLMYLYIVGGYFAKYPIDKYFSPVKAFTVCLLVIAITWLHKLYPAYFGPLKSKYLLRYTSPTVLLCAVFLLIGFSQCKFPRFMRTIIHFFAPLSFGVYLLHAQGTVYSNFMKNRFGPLGEKHTVMMLLSVFGVAVAWFVMGTLIDWLRQQLFALLRINKLCKWLDKQLEKVL